MRIPNYLYLAPSGIWHFRLRVPQDLVEKIGRLAFQNSLQTRELMSALRCASSRLTIRPLTSPATRF
jgi:hypothetical protein